MKVLYGASDEVARWVAERIDGCERGFGECQALGVVSDKMLAGIVFHNWSPETGVIEISAAAESPLWARPAILTELLEYPFDRLRCRMVLGRCSEHNTRARKLWRAFGATETAIPDLRGDGVAEIVKTLKASDWTRSRLYHGKAEKPKAA